MIEKKLDNYLKERTLIDFEDDNEPQPIDTKEFKNFFRDYNTEIHKATAKLEKDFTIWVKKNKVNDQSEDVRQWVRDDMGEYASRSVPEQVLDNIFNLVKK